MNVGDFVEGDTAGDTSVSGQRTKNKAPWKWGPQPKLTAYEKSFNVFLLHIGNTTSNQVS